MAKNKTEQKQQYMICALLDDLVPEDHLVRKLDRYIDWSFIYDICDPLYSNRGTNRVDPVVLFKMMFINIIFGYHSMRKTCEDIKVNLAYRWFLGLGFEIQFRIIRLFHKTTEESSRIIMCLSESLRQSLISS